MTINIIEIGKPFSSLSNGEMTCHFEIDVTEIIDRYDFHDAIFIRGAEDYDFEYGEDEEE